VLAQHLVRRALAAPASRSEAEAILEIAQRAGALFGASSDVPFRYPIAKADIHGEMLTCNENDYHLISFYSQEASSR